MIAISFKLSFIHTHSLERFIPCSTQGIIKSSRISPHHKGQWTLKVPIQGFIVVGLCYRIYILIRTNLRRFYNTQHRCPPLFAGIYRLLRDELYRICLSESPLLFRLYGVLLVSQYRKKTSKYAINTCKFDFS